MTAFRYRALNPDGKLVRGVLEGDSERQVRTQLRGQSLRPVEVAVANRPEPAASDWSMPLVRRGIGAGDLALLTRQLATLVHSNLPLDEALQAAAEQSRSARIKGTLLQVRSRVAEGHTLAYAMGEFPQVFSEMYRAMVKAGEHAGFLGPVLEQLADYTEQRQYTGQKLKMAMIYPFILVGVAIAVVVALMVFVVPELVGIFAHSRKELPLLTQGDRSQRFFSGLWRVAAGGCGGGYFYCALAAAQSTASATMAWFPAENSRNFPVGDSPGYSAIRLHTEHSYGQRSAAAGSSAHSRPGFDQPGITRGYSPGRRERAGRQQPESGTAAKWSLSADDGAYGRQWRGQW